LWRFEFFGNNSESRGIELGKHLQKVPGRRRDALTKACSEVMARHFPRPARDAVVNVVTGGIPRYSGS
jgi:hypothetical protein